MPSLVFPHNTTLLSIHYEISADLICTYEPKMRDDVRFWCRESLMGGLTIRFDFENREERYTLDFEHFEDLIHFKMRWL